MLEKLNDSTHNDIKMASEMHDRNDSNGELIVHCDSNNDVTSQMTQMKDSSGDIRDSNAGITEYMHLS